ncbi:integrase, catalytic region, zinc finger, CCHC-type containing protein [Tanacetum coccineum]
MNGAKFVTDVKVGQRLAYYQYSGLIVPVFQKGDDPIDAINHMMSFLTAVGRQTTYAAGTTRKYTPGASRSNTGKQWTVICYNCKGEGHIAKQCTKPKRKRDETWFNDKVLLVQAQASGQVLTEEEIAFLADPGLPDTQTSQTIASWQSLSPGMGLDALTEETEQNSNLLLNKKSLKLSMFRTIKYSRSKSPKLYEGNVILKMDAIVILDSDETLMLCVRSHSKMLERTRSNGCPKKEPLPTAITEHVLSNNTLGVQNIEVKMNQVLSENERLLAQAIDHDIVKTVVNLSVNDGCETVNECQKCLELKTELLNKNGCC